MRSWRSTGGRATTPSRPTRSTPGSSGRSTPPATVRGRARRSSTSATAATTSATLAAFDAAITPGTRLVSCRTSCGRPGAVLPDRADRRAGPRARGRRRRRRRPGGRRHPRRRRGDRRRRLRRRGPEVAARPGGDGRAGGPPVARRAAHAGAGRPFQLRALAARRHRGLLSAAPGGSSGSGMHRPSVVGMARAIGWLSMFVGLRGSTRAGRRSPAARPTGSPRSRA